MNQEEISETINWACVHYDLISDSGFDRVVTLLVLSHNC